ncbi:MAG: hypothetical protein NT062_17510 [Proteobacteria bacterium]|nr:hypothetical protein [Pseudomonadota bacterium]
MAVQDLEALERRLTKRGFKRGDVYLHECTACKEQAVLRYSILGRSGGRDIAYCQACGVTRSWRSVAGMETREEDLTFDLDTFLR